MRDIRGASPENDAARTVAARDERATGSNLAGAGSNFYTTGSDFMGSGDVVMAGHTGVVVRLPRQVRRGVILDRRDGVFANGQRYAFVWYQFQLGRGKIGDGHGSICEITARAQAKKLAKTLGLPFVDRTMADQGAPSSGAAR